MQKFSVGDLCCYISSIDLVQFRAQFRAILRIHPSKLFNPMDYNTIGIVVEVIPFDVLHNPYRLEEEKQNIFKKWVKHNNRRNMTIESIPNEYFNGYILFSQNASIESFAYEHELTPV